MSSHADAGGRSGHLELLEPWAKFAERFWYDLPGHRGLGCFGTGFNSWGVQTNQKYLAAMATLALDPATDEKAVGMSREQMMDRALAALRYSLATHVSGKVWRTDGTQWGHTWISGLGIERMMHAVDQLDEHLGDEDCGDLQRVLTSEADWLLAEHDVVAGLWAETGKNQPESNYWNGAILLRTALMYPDHDHCDAWTEKGYAFLLNAVNVPADAEDDRPICGKPLRKWHVGANFFPNYALDHHGYLNVGYMVICLSNLAMLHYAYLTRGLEAPEAIYHHGRDLWQLVRRLVFADGRLARIGGDSRQRYCYCQDYLLPTLILAADHWDDPLASHLEAGQLELIAAEQASGGDGSFLAKRLGHLEAASPYYYTRLEADKAVCLSMAAMWRRLRARVRPAVPSADAAQLEAELSGGWQEPRHGAMFHRCPTRLVSWSWRACDLPQGLCLPPQDGTLAEWSECMAGRVTPLGEVRRPDGRSLHNLVRSMQREFDGGFVTCGTTTDGAEINLPEGYRETDLVQHHIAFAALPDGHTALRIELARNGPRRTYFRDVRGLKLNVQNDLFNGSARTWCTENGTIRLETILDGVARVEDLASLWVNIEDRIAVVAVYGSESLAIYRCGARTAGYAGSLYSDELCTSVRLGPFDLSPGETILDNGAVVMASIDHEATQQYAADGPAARAAQACCDAAEARALVAEGLDGRRYLLSANFASGEDSSTRIAIELPGAKATTATDLATQDSVALERNVVYLEIAPGEARLLRIE